MTLIARRRGFAVMHIPRTGGSSLTVALSPYLDDAVSVQMTRRPGWQMRHHHGGMHVPFDDLPKAAEGLRLYATIRHPMARLLSAWRTRAANPGRKRLRPWLDTMDRDHLLLKPMVHFFRPDLHPVQAIRCETMQRDLDALCQRHRLPSLQLPHLNRGEQHHPLERHDLDAVRAFSREHYKTDFQLFGYGEVMP